MNSDQSFALRQLLRSYELQIEYLSLLVKYEMLAIEGALQEIHVIRGKMDRAAERLWQLRVEEQSGLEPGTLTIDPSLIPDLQYCSVQ
jgi:hypothetical protein